MSILGYLAKLRRSLLLVHIFCLIFPLNCSLVNTLSLNKVSMSHLISFSRYEGHVHKYEAVFWLFCGHLNCCYILINYFLLTYKVGINYAPIINRIIFQKIYFI